MIFVLRKKPFSHVSDSRRRPLSGCDAAAAEASLLLLLLTAIAQLSPAAHYILAAGEPDFNSGSGRDRGIVRRTLSLGLIKESKDSGSRNGTTCINSRSGAAMNNISPPRID